VGYAPLTTLIPERGLPRAYRFSRRVQRCLIFSIRPKAPSCPPTTTTCSPSAPASGGVRACRFAANFGAKGRGGGGQVSGGTCVNVGCIPKKAAVLRGALSRGLRRFRRLRLDPGRAKIRLGDADRNKDREIARLNGITSASSPGRMSGFMRGRARLADAHTVEIGGKRVTAKHILVATGGWPMVPEVPASNTPSPPTRPFTSRNCPGG